jgi:hypothetical protein
MLMQLLLDRMLGGHEFFDTRALTFLLGAQGVSMLERTRSMMLDVFLLDGTHTTLTQNMQTLIKFLFQLVGILLSNLSIHTATSPWRLILFSGLSDSSNRGVCRCNALSPNKGRKEGSIAHHSVALSEPFLSQIELERHPSLPSTSRGCKQH